MAKLKFGFHIGPVGIGVNQNFYTTLDETGIPFFAKGSDSLPYDAQLVAMGSDVPHTVVYRRSLPYNGTVPPSGNPDVPDYNKSPQQAAQEHWAWHKAGLPRELNPDTTWLETINEVDKNRAEWLAEFAIATAQLTMAQGYKWLAFGWSTGEPEVEHWQGPKMREFLALVAANPDKLGIALHEYSLDKNDIENGGGYLIGRFQALLDVNPNVNIYITEWGWESTQVPLVEQAMQDYLTIGALYAQYPQVKGAATWCLNSGWGGINQTVVQYIEPLLQLTLDTEFDDPPEPPTNTYYKELHLVPQDSTLADWLMVAELAFDNRNTIAFSADDVRNSLLLPDTRPDSKVVIYGAEHWQDDIVAYFTDYGINVELRPLSIKPSNPLEGLHLGSPFDVPFVLTSPFNAPREYGNGLHEGVDYDILTNVTNSTQSVLALYDGIVSRVEHKSTGYGNNVILEHTHNGNLFYTLYAHMDAIYVNLGEQVAQGMAVGELGSTGNSSGEHVHINLEVPNYGLRGYVRDWVVDPAPYIPIISGGGGGTSPNVAFGIHGPADPPITITDRVKLATANPQMIKVLSSCDKNNLNALHAEHPNIQWVIRAFLSFGGRNIGPAQFVSDTINDVTQCLQILGLEDTIVELHNEPNLYTEGLGSTWQNGTGFNTWFLDVLNRYRTNLPGVRFMFPGLSPGGSIDGVRIADTEFIAGCHNAVNSVDALGIHTYWNQTDMESALNVLDWYRSQFPTKYIYITEASNNKTWGNITPAQKAQQYISYWQALKTRPKMAGVTYFVLNASNPDWQWDTGSGEVWTDEMAVIVGNR